ncbi:MAG: hypothetical protein QOK31_1993 [Solirubrobacteraceae bacterium]|nr:hypothetical protein [Solirubrobacteraceae bacterium]
MSGPVQEPRAGRAEPPERWAHRLDPDLAAEREREERGEGPSEPPPSARPPGASRYGWFVGVIAVLALAYISINTLRTPGLSRGVPAGQSLPPFAVPLVTGTLDGDANLAVRAGRGAGRAGHTPACSVTDPQALNICRTAGDAPLVLLFFSERNAPSVHQLDVAQLVSRRFPQVRFAAVALKGDRGKLRRLIASHRWTFPVGYDRSVDVAARYGIPSVPALTLAYPGRIVARSIFRGLEAGPLADQVSSILRRPGTPRSTR